MSVDGLGLGLAPYITKELVKEVNEASGGFIEMVTFTFSAFSRRFYPKRLTISTFVIRSASIYIYIYKWLRTFEC